MAVPTPLDVPAGGATPEDEPRGGRLSPVHETTTHRFQTLIARALHGPPRDAAQSLLRTSHR